ncbi:hypothetical protein [Subsaximicrobium wynnwilliamsii]|uniref:hypothetical protein n=1 Tax=Subsaximicrobium wynnwilliamsii TaxID=291179 RepID=UPI001677EC0C|nr:hypothetical protein [Subsaximicrobium wynnwilliamsii]
MDFTKNTKILGIKSPLSTYIVNEFINKMGASVEQVSFVGTAKSVIFDTIQHINLQPN